MPDRLTEELLPLTVEPQPDEVVRVLVGRMEIMTPEEEAGILQLVRSSMESRTAHATESAAARAAGKTPEPYGIPKELLNLGRLAEPSLVRVIGISNDVNVRREGRLLLKSWQQMIERSLALQQQVSVQK